MLLTNVPTVELLAELDRRTQAKQPPTVHFYGVWPGERAGHYQRDRHGRQIWTETVSGREAGRYPWSDYRLPQPEGKIWHWHHPTEPLTLLLSWDRSADRRGNCCATFIIGAHVTAEAGLALARETFPKVFERIEAHLGRPVELAGPVSAVDL